MISPSADAAPRVSRSSRTPSTPITPEDAARPAPAAIAVARSAMLSTFASPVAPPSRKTMWSLPTATVSALRRPRPSFIRLSTPIFLTVPPSLMSSSSSAARPSEANSV